MRFSGWWVALSSLVLAPVMAFDHDPWFRNLYEIEVGCSGSYQSYDTIDRDGENLVYSSDDQWLRFFAGAVVTTRLRIQSELELVRTEELDPGVASVAVLLKALLLHDVIGDPVTCTAGLLVYGSPADRDPSVPYHGKVGVEADLTVGKELCYGIGYQLRAWSMLRLGIAEKGDPWAAVYGQLDTVFCDDHKLEFFISGMKGFGNQPFPDRVENFEGYGKLDHRSIDVGAGYRYDIPYLFQLYFLVDHRIYARNYPEGSWMLTLGIIYPFSL